MSSSGPRIGDIQMDGFSVKAEHTGSGIRVALHGNADMAVQERLKALLDMVSSAAKGAHATEVTFDWHELYFMNSSCLSLLLRFINGVIELSESARYKVIFRSNPNLKWQQKSLQALFSYAPEVVKVE